MKMREIINIVEASSKVGALYHVSSDPNLVINPDHELQQGQLGKGFYVSPTPKVWKDSLGERRYTYRVFADNLKIADGKDYPSRGQLAHWAIEKGYMVMAPVVRDNGDPVLGLDDKQLIRPTLTKTGEKLIWKGSLLDDPMVGLAHEYLKERGFNAYDPPFSRDGHQIIIFDPSIVKLKRLK